MLAIATCVDYLLHRHGLQAQQDVDNPCIFPYNEHAAQNWLTVPEVQAQ
jgi:hypothetical protein